MMARTSRRPPGSSAIELRHPLRLWQREVHSPAVVAQARLLLVDIAAERARANAAELATDPEYADRDSLKQSVERWRSVAAGTAIGDAGCFIALARGLAGERSVERLGDDSQDAALTALALAARGGSVPERVVACVELMLALPEIIGRSVTKARRARALAALFRTYRTMRWSASGGSNRHLQRSLSLMMESLAVVETAALRRGLFAGDLDRKVLFGRLAELSAAERLEAGGADETDHDEQDGGGCVTDLPASRRRIEVSGSGRDVEPSAGGTERPLSMVPFPKYDAGRLSDNRRLLGERYAALATPLPVTPVPSRQAVDGALEALAGEMPNFGAVIRRIGDELALARCSASRTALRLPPLLLVGPPGIGKTRFAARLAACLSLPWSCLALAGASDNRELAGTARGWSSAHAGWPVEQLVQLRTANPLLVIDEIDKAGGNDSNGRAVMSLLTLLERRTSEAFHDECLGGPIDLSSISWILTANDITGLPGPLLSRLIVSVVQPPGVDKFRVMLATMMSEVAAERGMRDPRMLPALPEFAVDRLRAGYARHGDPRRLRTELTRILAVTARAEERWAASPALRLN